jgi:hypothetical protein
VERYKEMMKILRGDNGEIFYPSSGFSVIYTILNYANVKEL